MFNQFQAYYGSFESDLYSERGFIFSCHKKIFDGRFQNNKKNGPGYYVFKDDSEFVGMFQDDLKHGFGRFILRSNNKIIAEVDGVFFKDKLCKLLELYWQDCNQSILTKLYSAISAGEYQLHREGANRRLRWDGQIEEQTQKEREFVLKYLDYVNKNQLVSI